MRGKTFVFKEKDNEKLNTDSRVIIVDGEKRYDPTSGYGFIQENDNPEMNSGFQKRQGKDIEKINILTNEYGCYINDKNNIPLLFKIDVLRSGNYEVTVSFMAQGEVFIFAGTRRLVYRGVLEKLTKKDCTFTLNVCDILPEKGKVVYEKRSIDISVVGACVFLQSISYGWVNCPTVYIAGDTTVRDHIAVYPYAPKDTIGGWGQMLSACVKKGVAISNHSKDKISIENYRSEGYYAMIKAHLRLGDYVLFHFSNVQEQVISVMRYRSDLIEFIEEARGMGAYPIIVTPFYRNVWYQGGMDILDFQSEFAQVCREVGTTYRVPVVDLHKMSKDFILENKEGKMVRYFTQDGNFLNDIGAYKMAEFVNLCYRKLTGEVKKDAYTKLAHYFKEEITPWEAS